MFKAIKTLIVFLAFAATLNGLHAQITLSPYSRYGLGDPSTALSTRNFSMGNIGIGSFDGTTINRANPASFADIRLTTLDFNGFGQISAQKSDFNEGVVGTAGFHNASIAFSNKRGFGLVAGLAPYTGVGYSVTLKDSIFADTAFKRYAETHSADGGLTSFYLGTGVRVLRHFNVGLNLNFAFGTTNATVVTDFEDNRFANVNIRESASLTGILPQFGVQYGDTLRLRKEVERKDVINDELKALDDELKALEKESEVLKGADTKLNDWNAKQEQALKEIDAERGPLEEERKRLMNDEVGNAKPLGKVQEKILRLEKKRKKIQREIKTRNRERNEAESRIDGRKKKAQERQESLRRELGEIEAGRRAATEIKRQAFVIRAGGIFETGRLSGDRLVTFDNGGFDDTLTYVADGSVGMPIRYGIGVSVTRPGRWSIGIDASFQDWTGYTYFGTNPGLLRALSLNAGGEWIPDLLARGFGKRIAYRAGLYHHGAHLEVDGQPITESGITFGVGLPIGYLSGTAQNFSRINIGVGLGRRGTLEGGLLQETTAHLRVGVNLNDIWFIKRRID